MSYSSHKLSVPPGFPELLQGLAKEVLRNQPKDIVSFAHDHFAKMVNDRNAQDNIVQAVKINETTNTMRPNQNVVIPVVDEQEEELPDLNSFDNSEVQAITKIQSGFRGMQARKQVKEMKPVENQEAEEELPDLNSFDNNEVDAITKIQSGFRGMQARKQVREMKPEEEKVEEEELPDLNSFDNNEVEAITKIQSGFRGMQARKQVREMKPEEEEEVVASQQNDEEEELPDLTSFDNSEVQAITKIQSGFRGMQARKQVRDMKTDDHEVIAAPQPVESILSPRVESNELPPSTAASIAVSNANMFSPRNEPLPETARENVVNENEEEEELPDLNSFDANEVNAITKIQSGFRGMQARKEVRELKEDNKPEEAEEELPKLESFNHQEVEAITKIQAGFRGMQVRKDKKQDE